MLGADSQCWCRARRQLEGGQAQAGAEALLLLHEGLAAEAAEALGEGGAASSCPCSLLCRCTSHVSCELDTHAPMLTLPAWLM